MKRFPLALLAFCLVLLWCAQVSAQTTMWVSDELTITVRTGPSMDNRVIASVKTGESLRVLETQDDGWAKVRTGEGLEGWVLSRYLMEERPAVVKLAELDPKNKSMTQRVDELTQENETLKAELGELRGRAQSVQGDYDKLQAESQGFLQLRAEHEQLKEQYETNLKKVKSLAAENESLKVMHNLKWFMAGAGVLFLGWILGLTLHRRKKRWNNSLY